MSEKLSERVYLRAELEAERRMAQKCAGCGGRKMAIIRIFETEGGNVPSLNDAGICQNENCGLYMDIKKMPTWRPKFTA